MRLPFAIVLATGAALALSACGDNGAEPEARIGMDEARATGAAQQGGAAAAAGGENEALDEALDEGATPLEERVATIGLLNKRNNLSEDLELKPGESREIGPVILTLATCERTAPWELPQETGAFVQVDVLERGASEHTRVFSGWLFKESPSLNVVEHPIYDVWVKDCAMRFPGDEPDASAEEAADEG
jgi:hypothetical protein